MKTRIFIILCTCLITAATNAQIKKGSILLGGSVGFSEQEFSVPDGRENRSFFISPGVGIATRDNQVAGINLFYSRSSEDDAVASPDMWEQKSYGAGVFLRNYKELARNFYLYGELSADYSYGLEKDSRPFNLLIKTKEHNISAGFRPGLSYAIKNKYHLELQLADLISVQYYKKVDTMSSPGISVERNSDGFAFETSLSNAAPITIGFRIVLGK